MSPDILAEVGGKVSLESTRRAARLGRSECPQGLAGQQLQRPLAAPTPAPGGPAAPSSPQKAPSLQMLPQKAAQRQWNRGPQGRAEGRGVLRGGQLRAGNPSTRPRPTACRQKQGQHEPSCSFLSPAQGHTDREEVPTVHGRGQPSRCPAGCLRRLPGTHSPSASRLSLPTRTDGARTVGLSLMVCSPHGAHPATPSV